MSPDASQAAPATVAGTLAEPIPYRQDDAGLLGVGMSALAVAALLLALVWWLMKRFAPRLGGLGAGVSDEMIRVLGARRLGHATRVFLVEADGRRWLVAESQRQVSIASADGAGPEDRRDVG